MCCHVCIISMHIQIYNCYDFPWLFCTYADILGDILHLFMSLNILQELKVDWPCTPLHSLSNKPHPNYVFNNSIWTKLFIISKCILYQFFFVFEENLYNMPWPPSFSFKNNFCYLIIQIKSLPIDTCTYFGICNDILVNICNAM